jgi:hypothetical protein
VTATSLLLRSRTEVESVVDLPASKLGMLEEYIRDGPPCRVIRVWILRWSSLLVGSLFGVFGTGTKNR